MAETPEAEVKRRCKVILKEFRVWFFMPVQNGMGVVGIPDFICCWHGVFLAIETKAPGKKANVTPNQAKRMDEIDEAQGMVLVIDDPEELRYILTVLRKQGNFKLLRAHTRWLQKAKTQLLSVTTKKSTHATKKSGSSTARNSTK